MFLERNRDYGELITNMLRAIDKLSYQVQQLKAGVNNTAFNTTNYGGSTTGLTNPLTADLDVNNYIIKGIGHSFNRIDSDSGDINFKVANTAKTATALGMYLMDGDTPVLNMNGNAITSLALATSTQTDRAASVLYVNNRIPTGVICMWSGLISAIPSGWFLCDGNNSTPNLLDKFIKSVPSATNPGGTGGSTAKTTVGHYHQTNLHTLTIAEMPAHSHPYTRPVGSGNYLMGGGSYLNQDPYATNTSNTGGGGSHDHGVTYSVQDTISDIRPSYYQLAFIMKS